MYAQSILPMRCRDSVLSSGYKAPDAALETQHIKPGKA